MTRFAFGMLRRSQSLQSRGGSVSRPWRLVIACGLLVACGSPLAEPAAPKRRTAPAGSAVAAAGPAAPPETPAAKSSDPFDVESLSLPESRGAQRALPSVFVETYRRVQGEYPNLDRPQLFSLLAIERKPDSALPFRAERAKYYGRVVDAFNLTPEEQQLLNRQGVTGIDHDQQYSMGSAYHAIYTRDLPVLVTTDSILHALHRSYSNMLASLERGWFTETLKSVLDDTHQQLAKLPAEERAQPSSKDVDLYLTVARNLLEGAGDSVQPFPAALPVRSALGSDKDARHLVRQIRSLAMQHPAGAATKLYGGARHIDFSQFKPRGHYAGDPHLRRYFQTLMWMGRADLGWNLTPAKQVRALPADPLREFHAAARFVLLLERAGQREQLQGMSDLIDYFVGQSDDVSILELWSALDKHGIHQVSQLAAPGLAEAARHTLTSDPGNAQTIRSQSLASDPDSPEQVQPPMVFQTFGQRFVLDSFALSEVVFDSIAHRGTKPKRQMPTGLDVMAVLGDDNALLHLAPELDEWKYSTNLLALRRAVEQTPEADWTASLYQGWLGSLRLLSRPSDSRHFPSAMRSQAWADKQLQTGLASWSELRHDTLLYAKQSYTAGTLCEYPEGYVEPYPAFFEHLSRLASNGRSRLLAFAGSTQERIDVLAANAQVPEPKQLSLLRAGHRMLSYQAHFFENFARHMVKLQTLAEKELAAKPFTQDEADYLRKTIDVRMQGSGGPSYSGWYPRLIFGGDPDSWDPVVADVHTAPDTGHVLEVATGNVGFVAVAVNNEQHNAVYVGPVYSYYEFQVPVSSRLTDEQWQRQLAKGAIPDRPTWTVSFQPPRLSRSLGGAIRPASSKSKPQQKRPR